MRRRSIALVAALGVAAGCGPAATSPAERTVWSDLPKHEARDAADPTAGLGGALETAAATRPTRRRASRSRVRRAVVSETVSDVRSVTSTAYCLTSTMANGHPTYRGAVAMNGVPLGSVWQVDGGGTYTVADRIGHGSQFDIAMPGDCAAARAYGRRTITIRRIG